MLFAKFDCLMSFPVSARSFFKEIVVDSPLGKTKYYATRVEFQVRGSPHVHCFLWVANAPVLTLKNKEEYEAFVDQIVHAFLPDRNENPELHDLVKLCQLHRHQEHVENIKMNLKGLNLESFSQRKQ